MSPVARSDGCDGFGLSDELVPGVAVVVDDMVVSAEDAVREPAFAHELPDAFPRVQFRRFAGNEMRVMLGGTVRRGERWFQRSLHSLL
jgi:hypothetical protein